MSVVIFKFSGVRLALPQQLVGFLLGLQTKFVFKWNALSIARNAIVDVHLCLCHHEMFLWSISEATQS